MPSYWETEELARFLCCMSDDNEDDVDDALMEKFDIDLDQFQKLVSKLLPLCTKEVSPLSRRTYRGFASDGCFIMREEIDVES